MLEYIIESTHKVYPMNPFLKLLIISSLLTLILYAERVNVKASMVISGGASLEHMKQDTTGH